MFQLTKRIPEILFLASVIFYWIAISFILNPVAIVLFVLALTMVFTDLKMLKVVVGVIYGLINGYMVLALISEFNEFPNLNIEAITLLLVGACFLAFNFYISFSLVIKNLPSQKRTQAIV